MESKCYRSTLKTGIMPPSQKIVNHLKPAKRPSWACWIVFLEGLSSRAVHDSPDLSNLRNKTCVRLQMPWFCSLLRPPSILFFTVVFFYQTLTEKFSLLTHLPSLHFMLFNYFKLIFGVGLTIPLLLS